MQRHDVLKMVGQATNKYSKVKNTMEMWSFYYFEEDEIFVFC